MDLILLEAQRAHQAMAWSPALIVVLDFFALCITAWVLYLCRGSGRDSARIAEILHEAREDSKRMQRYLFVKLGPAELK